MNHERDTDGAWEPCRSGEIGGMVRRMRWRRRRAFAWQAAGALVMGMLLGGLYVGARDAGLVRPGGEYRCGGIACTDVRAQAEDYVQGRLEPGLRRQVEFHLQRCPECGPMVRRMMPSQAGGPAAATPVVLTVRHASDGHCGCLDCGHGHGPQPSVLLASSVR